MSAMSILSRIGGAFSTKREFTLARPVQSDEPVPISQKVTPEKNRVPLDMLEAVYAESPVIFNSINKYTQILSRVNMKLLGDEKSVKFFNDFLDMIGKRGGEKTWEILKYDILKFTCMFGRMPVELIFNKEGTRVLDLDSIDPKTFDYAKTSSQKIVLNEYGNPIGYTQKLPFMYEPIIKIQPPPNVKLDTNSLYFPAERIALFKLFNLGDGFYPLGLIEPIYTTYIRHKASEEGFANANFRAGNPVPAMKIGNDMHQPTEEQIKNAVEDLKTMNSKSAFAYAYYNELGYLETKGDKRGLRTFLDYWVDMEVAGIGIPKAFATSEGGETNRATLARQEYIMKLSLTDVLNRIGSVIQNKIFETIAKYERENGNNIYAPKVMWNEIVLEELDSKAVRLVKYAQAGLIRPTPELEEFIRKIEELPISDIPKDEPIKKEEAKIGEKNGIGNTRTKE